jgi:hypothetical protein
MRFEAALESANALVASKMRAEDNARLVWNIFVAPEYSFANPLRHGNHEPGDVRHLSEGSKVSIEAWLKNLSIRHPKTLIFPGSIAWKKPLVRNLETYLNNKEATRDVVDKAAFTTRFLEKGQSRQQKSTASIRGHAAEFMKGRLGDVVSGDIRKFKAFFFDSDGKWWFETTGCGRPYEGKLWTENPKLATMVTHAAPSNQQKLNELGGGTVTHMARNTSLIYLNGRKRAKYHKAQDYHEVVDTKGDTVYVPGQSVPTFKVGGLTYGVEICLDHAFASLRTRLFEEEVPEVIVLMSAKVKFEQSNLAAPGAMVIHACSKESWSFVGRGGVANAGCTTESPPTATDYTVYSFDV